MASVRTNNFDTLRVFAAVMVLASHAFPLAGEFWAEPIWRLSREQTSGGSLAVTIFFIISGYLITMSFGRTSTAVAFVAKRALRLLPALAVVVLVLSLIAGPILSSELPGAYFSAPQTYLFPAVNLSLVRFSDGLPGVFANNPYAHAVDGSLWTLHYEVACYGLILALGIAGVLNKYVTAALFLGALVLIRYWIGGDYVSLGTDFLAGVALYHWQVPLRRNIALVCAALWVVSFLTVGLRLASATAGAYVIIFLALSSAVRLPNLARWGDVSYGIYIWAFPVQQAVADLLGRHVTWYADALLSLPVVLGLAALSWHFVEAPALALKRRWAYRAAPVWGASG